MPVPLRGAYGVRSVTDGDRPGFVPDLIVVPTSHWRYGAFAGSSNIPSLHMWKV
jgi:hypothetical protein